MTEIRDRYARLADRFTATIDAVPPGDDRWQQPSPCPDWQAIDVVRHVVDAHRTFFGLAEHDVPEPPADPLAAWPVTRDAMLDALVDADDGVLPHEGEQAETLLLTRERLWPSWSRH